MATGRVRAGFFHTRPDPRVWTQDPNPARLVNGFFLRGPDPPHRAPLGHGTSGPILWPKKKNFLPNTNFLSNQTSRGKRTQENPELNISETNKNHYFLSNQQIGTRIIKIALKLENTNLITIENTTDRNKNHYFSLQYFPTSKVKTRINI